MLPPDVARRLPVIAAGLLAIALCIAVGLLIGSRMGTPSDDSAEAGFARDMATHHAQAVEMSFVVRDKSSDQELRTLASDIIVTQSAQRGIFMGWLQQWGLPQASTRPRMAWMPGHEHTARAPDGTVLAVGATRRQPVERPDGGIAFAGQMTVTLSCDHRVVDGALGAELLSAFRGFIENPVTALA